LTDQTTKIFTKYLANVHVGYQDKEIIADAWISPNSEEEDISLSKGTMHKLGFQLINAEGANIWEARGIEKFPVEVPVEEFAI
ncbi:MAG: hypothetical protein GY861_15115, partial [bacterium]|nr:hypothetical protein [bacterium]